MTDPYPAWQTDREQALARVAVTHEFIDGRPVWRGITQVIDPDDGWTVRHVIAEAGTGSRYSVVATRLGKYGREHEGGPILVTVLAPWQDAWTLAEGGYLDESYVAEHLCGDRLRARRLHGGDLAALTQTVRRALGRYDHLSTSTEGDE